MQELTVNLLAWYGVKKGTISPADRTAFAWYGNCPARRTLEDRAGFFGTRESPVCAVAFETGVVLCSQFSPFRN